MINSSSMSGKRSIAEFGVKQEEQASKKQVTLTGEQYNELAEKYGMIKWNPLFFQVVPADENHVLRKITTHIWKHIFSGDLDGGDLRNLIVTCRQAASAINFSNIWPQHLYFRVPQPDSREDSTSQAFKEKYPKFKIGVSDILNKQLEVLNEYPVHLLRSLSCNADATVMPRGYIPIQASIGIGAPIPSWIAVHPRVQEARQRFIDSYRKVIDVLKKLDSIPRVDVGVLHNYHNYYERMTGHPIPEEELALFENFYRKPRKPIYLPNQDHHMWFSELDTPNIDMIYFDDRPRRVGRSGYQSQYNGWPCINVKKIEHTNFFQLDYFPNLEELDYYASKFSKFDDSKLNVKYNSLTKLSLSQSCDGVKGRLPYKRFINMLNAFPNLKELQLGKLPYLNDKFPRKEKRQFSSVIKLTWDPAQFSAPLQKIILTLFPNLQEIVVSNFPSFMIDFDQMPVLPSITRIEIGHGSYRDNKSADELIYDNASKNIEKLTEKLTSPRESMAEKFRTQMRLPSMQQELNSVLQPKVANQPPRKFDYHQIAKIVTKCPNLRQLDIVDKTDLNAVKEIHLIKEGGRFIVDQATLNIQDFDSLLQAIKPIELVKP